MIKYPEGHVHVTTEGGIDDMRQSVVLLILLLTAVSLMVPMTAADAVSTNPSEPVPDYPEEMAEDLAGEHPKETGYWGILGLAGLVGFFLLVIFLEYKGILKDPWLD